MTDLRTFGLPGCVEGTDADVALGTELVRAWRTDRMFRIVCDRWQARRVEDAFEVSRRFFALPVDLKSRCVSDLTYAGYTPGEDVESFTVCLDVPLNDVRVQAQWPCHGPVPWPSLEYRRATRVLLDELRRIGDKLANLVTIGLGATDFEALAAATEDGWHHLVVQRFRTPQAEVPKYGLLGITARENATTLLVSPGELISFMTGGQLRPAPPAVQEEGQVMTYFHEPNFDTVMRPLDRPGSTYIHYGTHFTDIYLRRYPDRSTTRRILSEDRLTVLAGMSRRASVGA